MSRASLYADIDTVLAATRRATKMLAAGRRPTKALGCQCRFATIDVAFKGLRGKYRLKKLVQSISIHCPVCGAELDPREVAALAVSDLRAVRDIVDEDLAAMRAARKRSRAKATIKRARTRARP